LVVVSQQGFRDGVKTSRRFHEHSESSLQRFPEDYCSDSRLQEVVICAMEGISRKKVFLPKAIRRVSRWLLVGIRNGLPTSVTSWFVAVLIH
jgi:hypothetical protein